MGLFNLGSLGLFSKPPSLKDIETSWAQAQLKHGIGHHFTKICYIRFINKISEVEAKKFHKSSSSWVVLVK